MFALASRSFGTSVLKSEIRVADGQPGTLHVGDKYPIVQASFSGAPTGVTGTSVLPPPTVNFEDLGVVLKVTPAIHSSDEVSLEVEVEYKVLGSQTLNGIPTISSRKFEARIRLNTSEYAVVSGLMSETKTVTKSGMAGLADIPLLGWFFRNTTKEKDSSQTLLVIKPHVIVAPPGESAQRTIYVGSDNRPLTPI